MLLDWQTEEVLPIFKKGYQKVCSNCKGITLLSLPGKVYARVLERRVHPNRPSVKLVLFCNELSCCSLLQTVSTAWVIGM